MVSLVKVTKENKEILWHLLQFLLYEISSSGEDLNTKGEYDYKYFDLYFEDDNRDAYFIYLEKQIVGFVMVNDVTINVPKGKSIAEFFVIPKYRRLGIGTKASMKVFDLYDTLIEVRPLKTSISAKLFWDRVIISYTKGDYKVEDNTFIFKGKNGNRD